MMKMMKKNPVKMKMKQKNPVKIDHELMDSAGQYDALPNLHPVDGRQYPILSFYKPHDILPRLPHPVACTSRRQYRSGSRHR